MYKTVKSSDVHDYVTSCEVCQRAKLALPTEVPLLNTHIGRTMQLVQVDILEVPLSRKGNIYLLVVEDAFTEWLECYPIPNQKTETITEKLVELFSILVSPNFCIRTRGEL